MKRTDRIMRAAAFYVSVTLFLILLPIVLSYALGYKIDYHGLKVYKTGLIYINTHPAGASIYVNGKEYPQTTPARIEELKPGRYRIEVRREAFYPWEKELEVKPKMVTRADKITLFPIIQDITKVSMHETVNFIIPDSRGSVYYMARSGLLKSNIDGTSMKMLSTYSNWPDRISGKKFSGDGNNILYFNDRKIFVIYLNEDRDSLPDGERAKIEEVLDSPDPVLDAFWYSGSAYIIAATSKEIKGVELGAETGRNAVSLYKFNSPPQGIYYDEYNDSIYFTDISRGAAGKDISLLYRMDLRQKFFDQFMKVLLVKRSQETAGYETQ